MRTKKKATIPKGEKMYSYDEYRKEFGVITKPEPTYLTADPRVFGVKLAHEALKKVKQEIEGK
jgi:hypothetical protein